jgi:hypothetical protein
MAKRIAIEHPLWNRLRKLDKAAAKRFPAEFDRGFGALGLILYSRPQHGGYWCTPTNTLAFAGTGGEGVHFSFLVEDGNVTEKSPVVITIPQAFDQPNFIGGESLFDFLCLGFHRGYFALETASSDRFFEAYASDKWPLTEDNGRPPDWDWAVGYGVNEHQRKLLDFLIAEIGLSPWKDLKRKFQRLQKLYLPLLEIPECGKGLG